MFQVLGKSVEWKRKLLKALKNHRCRLGEQKCITIITASSWNQFGCLRAWRTGCILESENSPRWYGLETGCIWPILPCFMAPTACITKLVNGIAPGTSNFSWLPRRFEVLVEELFVLSASRREERDVVMVVVWQCAEGIITTKWALVVYSLLLVIISSEDESKRKDAKFVLRRFAKSSYFKRPRVQWLFKFKKSTFVFNTRDACRINNWPATSTIPLSGSY